MTSPHPLDLNNAADPLAEALRVLLGRAGGQAWVASAEDGSLLHLGEALRGRLGDEGVAGGDLVAAFGAGRPAQEVLRLRSALADMGAGLAVTVEVGSRDGRRLVLHGGPVPFGAAGCVLAGLAFWEPAAVGADTAPGPGGGTIWSRDALLRRLEARVREALPSGRVVGVLSLDIDDFGELNDILGEEAGDHVLERVGQRLAGAVGPDGTLARRSGDAFVAIVEGQDGPALVELAARLQRAVAAPLDIDGLEHRLSASIGVSFASADRGAPAELLGQADRALGVARRRGVGRIEPYQPALQEQARLNSGLRRELPRALEGEEIELWYQPVVCLDDGRLCGFEALVRWRHPTRGIIPPLDFLPVVARCGWMGALDRLVLRSACAQMRAWVDAHALPDEVRMAVNVSPDQACRSAFLTEVLRALEDTGLPPGRLSVELTETGLVDSPDEVRRTLRGLRDAGVGVALDDFGTGFSSLSHLIHFPIDTIKVDRSFTAGVHADPAHARVVRSTIQLGRNLGLRVVAEGVETDAQRRFLAEQDCHMGQGWLFARALPAPEIGRLYFGA